MDNKQVYLKGNEYFATCNYEQALNSFLSILETNSRDEHLLLKISQCYQELEHYDDAIEFLERLLNITLENNNYKKAIAICKRILSIDPDDAEVVLKLANIFRTLKQYGEACYYYKIVAQYYEYSGFMDKAIEVLQIIKELGYEGVEDLLEIVKKEYKRGAKAKADNNIDAIIKELKDGEEYTLLDVALNLALSNSPNNFSYVEDMAKLYFRTSRLVSSIHLCLWGLHLNPRSSSMLIILIKDLWAMGNDELAYKMVECVINGDFDLDDNDAAKTKAARMITLMRSFGKERSPVQEELGEIDKELLYLEKEEYTSVDHSKIERGLMKDELNEQLDSAVGDKTSIIDLRKKGKYAPHVLEELKEAEILISEGLYDKAGLKLFSLLADEPGDKEIKGLLSRVVKMSGALDSSYGRSIAAELHTDKTPDEMMTDLENYLDSDVDRESLGVDKKDEQRTEKLVEVFSGRLKDVLLASDYRTIFDLGIAYMELELWNEASLSFERVVDYLSESKSDDDRLTSAKIYWAYSVSRTGGNMQAEEAIQFINGVLSGNISEKHKLDALYYLAQCYEFIGDKDNAKKKYRDIMSTNPSYRDVGVRASILGN